MRHAVSSEIESESAFSTHATKCRSERGSTESESSDAQSTRCAGLQHGSSCAATSSWPAAARIALGCAAVAAFAPPDSRLEAPCRAPPLPGCLIASHAWRICDSTSAIGGSAAL